jgi:hypothetical protein
VGALRPAGPRPGANLDNAVVAPILWRLLNTGRGVAHNIKFELRHLARWFLLHLDGELLEEAKQTHGYFPFKSDTMIEAYVLSQWRSNARKSLTKEVFNTTSRS